MLIEKIEKAMENGKKYYVRYRYNRDILYYKDEDLSILHREEGPAIEFKNGYKEWWIDGKRHREGGAAIEYANCEEKEWWVNGERHRIDGPAIEYTDRKFYFLNDIQYKEEDYWAIIKLGAFV